MKDMVLLKLHALNIPDLRFTAVITTESSPSEMPKNNKDSHKSQRKKNNTTTENIPFL